MESVHIDIIGNLREDDSSGDILLDARKPSGDIISVRITRGTAGLLGLGIVSAIEASERPVPDRASIEIPTVTQSRPVQMDSGEPCVELRLYEKIPIVLRIRPGAEPPLRQAIAKVEELRELARTSLGGH